MTLFISLSLSLFVLAGALAAPRTLAPIINVDARSPAPLRLEVGHLLDHQNNLQPRGTGGADVYFGSYWFVNATAGGQNVTVTIDTGSADLWLLGPNLPPEQTAGQQIYDPSLSSSAIQLQGETFDISYGEGGNGVSGPVYADTFVMDTIGIGSVSIGSADNITGLSLGTFMSGIIGLAFQGGNSVRPTQQPTFMEDIQPFLDEPIFVCNFKMGGGGFIEFGTIEDSLYLGELTTLQADNATKYPSSWSSENMTYVSNGQVLGSFDIVFDTGGPSTSGPIEVVSAYYAQIANSTDVYGDGSAWTVPCDAEMPDLEFHFAGGAVGTIPGYNLLLPQDTNGNGMCATWFVLENSPTRGLVGDAFFNSNVVVFNQAEATISWAPQNPFQSIF